MKLLTYLSMLALVRPQESTTYSSQAAAVLFQKEEIAVWQQIGQYFLSNASICQHPAC